MPPLFCFVFFFAEQCSLLCSLSLPSMEFTMPHPPLHPNPPETSQKEGCCLLFVKSGYGPGLHSVNFLIKGMFVCIYIWVYQPCDSDHCTCIYSGILTMNQCKCEHVCEVIQEEYKALKSGPPPTPLPLARIYFFIIFFPLLMDLVIPIVDGA